VREKEPLAVDAFNDMNWFAVQVKRFREGPAAANVAANGLEVFLPLVKIEHPEECVIRVVSKPLFQGYFFARFNPVISLGLVEGAWGVLRVVKSGMTPVPVEDSVVKEIQDRVNEDGLIRLERRQLRPGDSVSVNEGPFAGMMGRVEAELDDGKRVAILLKSLWNARMVINRRWVEVEVV